jgi:hypothetical protein
MVRLALCAFCAPPAPDARRLLPLASSHQLTRHYARLTAAGIHTRRHGDVHIIFELSARAGSDLFPRPASSPTRPSRGELQVSRALFRLTARCLPSEPAACRPPPTLTVADRASVRVRQPE